jgi:hypothetical protein
LREKRRKPASLPSPELPAEETKVQRDPRLRNLLPLLESLPEELRDALVSTLEAVVRTSHLVEVHKKTWSGGRDESPGETENGALRTRSSTPESARSKSLRVL